MACSGCRKGPSDRASSVGLMPSDQTPDPETGIVPLAAYPGCTEPYDGPYASAMLWVVGRGHANEQLFPKGEKNQAIVAARARRGTIDRLPARMLCRDAVVAVLGA